MLDENTLLCMSGNIRTSCDDTPFYPHLFSKYTIAYNYSSGEIQTTEICTDGSFGETFSCNLCRSKNGVFICEGQLVGDEIYHNTPNGLVKLEVRWCFEGRDDRERIIEAYEQWLHEQ